MSTGDPPFGTGHIVFGPGGYDPVSFPGLDPSKLIVGPCSLPPAPGLSSLHVLELLRGAYDAIKTEYLAQKPEDNPPKLSLTMERDDEGIVNVFANTLTARLSDGTVGTKLIYVNEFQGQSKTVAKTVLVNPDGEMRVVDSAFLTEIRCGLMACFAIERFFGKIDPKMTIGLIGTGKVNLTTARLLCALFGVESFILRGSPRNPGKNADDFPGSRKLVAERAGWLRAADVTIVCTNTPDTSDAYEYHWIAGPRLFISQDGGWVLDPSFREECASFTDNEVQLRAHIKDEFPDDDRYISLDTIACHRFNSGLRQPAVVYLYGIGLTDVIVARDLEGIERSHLAELCR